MRHSIILSDASKASAALLELWREVIRPALVDGKRLHLEVRTETRSTAQNRMLWSVLGDIARQVEWPVDGKLQKLDADEWKDILSAGLTKTRVAQGVEGGFVMLGSRTSKMTVAEMGDLITDRKSVV